MIILFTMNIEGEQMKLKKKFIPIFYLLSITGIFLCILLLGNAVSQLLPLDGLEEDYKVINIIDEPTMPVNSEEKIKVIKPYISENVSITKKFYDAENDNESKKNSLIYYENTYMQNTGILYSSDTSFDVVSVLEGRVRLITDDELLGKVVEIIHGNDLVTVYQSLSEVKVNLGDTVKQGDIIGISGPNEIINKAHNLLFEVYSRGNLINPENIYNTNIKDLME